jgi:hypothetical protein
LGRIASSIYIARATRNGTERTGGGHLDPKKTEARIEQEPRSNMRSAPRPSKWGRRKWSAWGEGPPKRTTYMSRVAVSDLLS